MRDNLPDSRSTIQRRAFGTTRTTTGTFFADAAGRVHELRTQRKLTFKEAGADPRLNCSAQTVRRLVSAGQLYPVCRENARPVRLFACALDDFLYRATATAISRASAAGR